MIANIYTCDGICNGSVGGDIVIRGFHAITFVLFGRSYWNFILFKIHWI